MNLKVHIDYTHESRYNWHIVTVLRLSPLVLRAWKALGALCGRSPGWGTSCSPGTNSSLRPRQKAPVPSFLNLLWLPRYIWLVLYKSRPWCRSQQVCTNFCDSKPPSWLLFVVSFWRLRTTGGVRGGATHVPRRVPWKPPTCLVLELMLGSSAHWQV